MFFPVFVDNRRIRFVVIGGGSVALSKLKTLAEYGAQVTVVAKACSAEVQKLAAQHEYPVVHAPYATDHINQGDCIIAATNQPNVNACVHEDCVRAGKLVNVVDKKSLCNFIFPALIRRGDITIAVSSAGTSPVLARVIKETVQRALPAGLEKLNTLIKKHTLKVKKKLPRIQSRRLFWHNFFESHVADIVRMGNIKEGERILLETLHNADTSTQSCVYFIGAGPGDSELLTLKALRLLSRADVVLHDRLVSPEILTYARRDAQIVSVGKQKNYHPIPQERISDLLVSYAKQGKIVARLKGGDATIFAHLAHEIEAVHGAHIPFQIVPGISAASGAAAALGFPLTSRNQEQSFRVLTYYKNEHSEMEFWGSLVKSNDFLVFYMSAHQAGIIADALLQAGKSPATPIAVIEQATTPYQKHHVTKLGTFTQQYEGVQFASPSLLCIGHNLDWTIKHTWHSPEEVGIYFPAEC